jgi:hypothetical protein
MGYQAGLLALLTAEGLPIPAGQWRYSSAVLFLDYSSGDCSGFSPDSLLRPGTFLRGHHGSVCFFIGSV